MRKAWPSALLIITLIFGPLAFGAVEDWSLAILALLIFSLMFFSAINLPTLRIPGSDALFYSVLAVTAIGLLQRLNVVAINGPTTSWPSTAFAFGTNRALILWSSFAALTWCLPRIVVDMDSFRRVAWAVFLLAVSIAVIGLLQKWQGNTEYYGIRTVKVGSPFGPYTNHNHAANLMGMGLLLGFGIFLSRFFKSRRTSTSSLPDLAATQGLILFFLGVLAYAFIETHSRGALHALLLALGVVGIAASGSLPRKLRTILAGALLVAGISYAASIALRPEFVGLHQGTLDDSTAYRVSMYRSGLRMVRDFPFLGVGLGSLQNAFPIYQEALVLGLVDHLHSDWLELLVETGLLGLVALATGLCLDLGRAFKDLRKNESLEMRCLVGGGIAAALAFIFHGFVEFAFHIPGNAVVFLALVAWLSCAGRLGKNNPSAKEDKSHQTQRWLSSATALGLSIACLPMLAGSWYSLRASAASPDQSPLLLDRALSWERNPEYEYQRARVLFHAAQSDTNNALKLSRQSLASISRALDQERFSNRNFKLERALLSQIEQAAPGKP